ncbi:hypothetical protein RRSWK_03148 [Rhodopirellula sp. SWK7]|nr:hypothetical protein RRSWK_03148 [Rhodopirellula sp. SWK7]
MLPLFAYLASLLPPRTLTIDSILTRSIVLRSTFPRSNNINTLIPTRIRRRPFWGFRRFNVTVSWKFSRGLTEHRPRG